MATRSISLRNAADPDSKSLGIVRRVQMGTRFVMDNSPTNGLFSRGASKITGEVPIYIDFDLTTQIAGAIAGMGAAAKRGCAEAANKAAVKVRRRFVGIAQRDMTCSPAEAERAISVTHRATESDTAAVVTIEERRLPLNKFGPFETRAGVSATSSRSRGSQDYPGAFIAAGSDGVPTVFRRETDRRYPLDELYGPSVRDTVNRLFDREKNNIELILFRELITVTARIVNENFGYSALGGFEENITDIA